MAIVILGIDLGKNICSVVGMDEDDVVVLRRRMRETQLSRSLPSCRFVSWPWRRAVAHTISGDC